MQAPTRTHPYARSHTRMLSSKTNGTKYTGCQKRASRKNATQQVFFSQPMRRKTKAMPRSKNQVFRQEFSFSFGSPGVTANALTHFATLPDHVLVHMCYGRALIRPGAPFKAGRISVKMEWSLILARLDANKVNAAAAAAKPRCHSKKLLCLFFPLRCSWASFWLLLKLLFSSICV